MRAPKNELVESRNNNLFINPDYLVPQLSTKLYRSTYSYLKRFYSERIFDEICHELGMPSGYLLADDNWVSVEFGRQFTKLVRAKTNDQNIYRKIGRFFMDPQNINPIEHQILKTAGPFGFFKMMARTYARTNQACALISTPISFGHYEITIQPVEGTIYADMALNTLGVLEGLEEFYNLKRFSINLNSPIEPGEEVAQFKIQISFAAIRYFVDLGALAVTLVGLSAAIGYLIYIWEMHAGLRVVPGLTVALVIAVTAFLRTRKSLNILKRNVELYYDKSREKNVQLYEKSELLDRRYREANLLRELSTELISVKDPQKVLQICLNSLETKFDFHQIALFQVAKKRGKLYLSESRGLTEVRAKIGDVEFEFPNPRAKEGFFATILERGRSALILNIPEYKKVLQERNQRLLEMLNVGSLIVCPIQTPGEKYGLLTIFGRKGESSLTKADKFLLEKVANFLALYFDNAANFEKEAGLRKIFQQYVPPIVLEEFTRDGGETVLTEPKRSEIISVFIDLRDFTSMSEKISPERVVQIISRYADFVSSIFSKHGFVIDNIVGDAVVMFLPCSSDAKGDLRAFVGAIHTLDSKWPELKESMGQLGHDSFKLGVGANIGPALVGNVGGSVKRNYTALGDTVNIASRLQSLSKKFPAQLGQGNLTVIVSDSILQRLDHKDAKLFSEKLRGRDELTYFANVDLELVKKAS